MGVQKFSTLLLYAVILSGGFGIVRMIFVRHDPVGILAIALSLVLAWVYMHFARQSLNSRTINFSSKLKEPVRLALIAREEFEVFPGRPEGYAGYTDYTAMSVTVNDDLVGRPPEQQYALLGFGSGFLNAIQDRLNDVTSHHRVHFHVSEISQTSGESIGWLAYLQRSGTDNADPSTKNLHSVIRAISKDVLSNGPITMNFWDKVHNKLSENLAASGTSDEMLSEWTRVYEASCEEGQRQGVGAIVDAEPVTQV